MATFAADLGGRSCLRSFYRRTVSSRHPFPPLASGQGAAAVQNGPGAASSTEFRDAAVELMNPPLNLEDEIQTRPHRPAVERSVGGIIGARSGIGSRYFVTSLSPRSQPGGA